jgi:hypothetical protein
MEPRRSVCQITEGQTQPAALKVKNCKDKCKFLHESLEKLILYAVSSICN